MRRVTAMPSKSPYLKLILFAAFLSITFLYPLDSSIQTAFARPVYDLKANSSNSLSSPVLPTHLTPRLEIDLNADMPQPELIACGGIEEVNTGAPVKEGQSQVEAAVQERESNKISIASLFLFSIAASFMMCLLKYMRQANRNAVWMFGGAAAALLMITGFIWGNNGSF